MKRITLFISWTLLLALCPVVRAQTPAETKESKPRHPWVKVITRPASAAPELPYDAGTLRFLASSEETNGAWSMFEAKEMPGY